MTQEQLIALAERCEQAGGPDRMLDYDIHCRNGMDGVGMYGAHPKYTASIDTALTLVPEWGKFQLDTMDMLGAWARIHSLDAGDSWDGEAKTPALALCAAALRASQQGGE